MNDIVPHLIKQAEEIATEGHNGWGNTMISAAEEIERLRERIARLEEALRLSLRVAESWTHDQLDGTRLLNGALAELEPARAALEDQS